MVFFAFESPGFESQSDILSLFSVFFYVVSWETTETAAENLYLWLHNLW